MLDCPLKRTYIFDKGSSVPLATLNDTLCYSDMCYYLFIKDFLFHKKSIEMFRSSMMTVSDVRWLYFYFENVKSSTNLPGIGNRSHNLCER